MFDLAQLQQSGVVWLMLAIAIITAFFNVRTSFIVLALSLVSALILGHLNLASLAVIISGLVISFLHHKTQGKIKLLLQSMVVLWMIALAAHLLPGFNNLQVLDQVISGTNSQPFNMYLNIDKPLVFFALILLIPNLLKQQTIPETFLTKMQKYQFSGLVLLTILFIYALAFMLGLLQVELSTPHWIWIFALNNLIITCVVEEAFFRGFIQQKLTIKTNPLLALVITSVLFGIAHFGGGIAYVFVATIAGLLYGLTYMYTGRLIMAILVHFVVNIFHLLLFTYPLLK